MSNASKDSEISTRTSDLSAFRMPRRTLLSNRANTWSSRSDNGRTCPKNESDGEAVFEKFLMPRHSMYFHFRFRPKLITSRNTSSAVIESSDKNRHSSVNGSETPRRPVKGLFTSITGKTADNRSSFTVQK